MKLYFYRAINRDGKAVITSVKVNAKLKKGIYDFEQSEVDKMCDNYIFPFNPDGTMSFTEEDEGVVFDQILQVFFTKPNRNQAVKNITAFIDSLVSEEQKKIKAYNKIINDLKEV